VAGRSTRSLSRTKRAVPCSQGLATAVRSESRLLENLGGSPAATARYAAATLGYGATTNQAQVKITARKGAVDRYVWGDKCLSLCRCATCGCVTHWQLIGRGGKRMGVNFRNFDPSVIETTRIRRLDGANTWKFLD
jgi:hypothetical protein